MEKIQSKQIDLRVSTAKHTQSKRNSTEPEQIQLQQIHNKSILPVDFWNSQKVQNSKQACQKVNLGINSVPITPLSLKIQKEESEVQEKLVIPKITFLEVFFEIITLVIFVYTWAYFVIGFSNLPNRVPVKNNLDGSHTSIKKQFFILIIMGDSFAYCLMSVLQLVPHKFKYLVDITPENNYLVFLTTRKFILQIKFITLCMILYTTIALFNIAQLQWNPSLIYLLVLAVIPYTLCGWLYYNRLIKLTINPYA